MKTLLTKLILPTIVSLASASEVVPRVNDEYDPKKWPKAELKLSQAATLKDVFDSGLRPYRFPGLENTTLELKHLALIVELGSKNQLPTILAEMIRIKPFRDGEIATIEGFTPKLTLVEAKERMLKWLPYGANQRAESDLGEYLEAVDRDYLDFDNPYRGIPHGCSITWTEPGWKTKGGGPQVVAWFRKTANKAAPLRLHFKATWSSNRPSKDRGSYRPQPIKPPPGYEGVDMTAPEKFGPDSAADILRSQGVDIGESSYVREDGPPTTDDPTSKEVGGESAKKNGKAPVEGRMVPMWLWLIIGILVIGICGLLLRRWKSRTVT